MNDNSTITFDLSTVTARALAPHLEDMGKGHMSWMLDIMPLVCTACPFGEPNKPETYDFPVFSDEAGQMWDAFQLAVKAVPEKITFASFDLKAIKAKDFDIIVDQINGIKVNVIAGLLAKYVKACPEVKDVSDPEAYLDLPYYTQFRALAKRLSNASKEQMENFLKRHGGK